MNPGILASGRAPPPTPFGLLGQQTPVPMPDARIIADPRAIPRLAAWWDASDATTFTLNGSNVSQWRDKSGNGFHLSQGTASDQPVYARQRINGLNAVVFGPISSVTHRLTNSALSVASPTVVAVMRLSAAYSPTGTVQAVLFDTFTSTGGRCVFAIDVLSSTAAKFQRSDSLPDASAATTAIVPGRTTVVACGSRQFGCDLVLNSVFGLPASQGQTGLVGISLGNIRGNPSTLVPANQYVWDGEVCEVLVYAAQVSDQQRRGLERYLANKWGAVTA